jgi:hypothetical protein
VGEEPIVAARRLYLTWGAPPKRVTWEFRAPAGEVVTLRSELGRVRLASGGGAGAEVTARADASGRLRVSAEALGVGEPEMPGDFLAVASSAGTERHAVWIEPALGQWRGAADGGEIELGIAAVHAALVRTDRGAEVVLVSPPRRRRSDGSFARGPDGFVWDFDAVDRCELARLDPETLNVRLVPFEGSGLEDVNLFCSGHVHLADGRLLFAGGHVSSRPGDPVTAGRLHLFDPRGPGEGWQRVPVPLARERWYPSLVTLPDGRVLIASGSGAPLNGDHRDHLPLAGYYGTVDAGYELFDPARGQIAPPQPAAARLVDLVLDRRYHSTALLLPDGSVLKMGSTGGFGAGRDEAGKPWTRPRFDAERYLPGYLWRGPRPILRRLLETATVGYDTRLELVVTTTEPAGLRVLALRLGSVTHGLDMDQRAVFLRIENQRNEVEGETILAARAPSSGAVAPPGDYQLVALDARDVPSRGLLVRFGAGERDTVRRQTDS